MEDLLHGDIRWLAGPAAAVPAVVATGGGMSTKEEEAAISW